MVKIITYCTLPGRSILLRYSPFSCRVEIQEKTTEKKREREIEETPGREDYKQTTVGF